MGFIDNGSLSSKPSSSKLIYLRKSSMYSIESALEQLNCLTKIAREENEMFHRFLEKVDGDIDQEILSTISQAYLRSSRLRSCTAQANRFAKLNFQQKCIVAQYETEEIQKDISSLEQSCNYILDEYKAALEEASEVEKDIARNRIVFDKNVTSLLNQGVQHATRADKFYRAFVRFHHSHMKKLDTMENNLRMSIRNHLITCKRLKKLIAHINDQGSPPGPIDIEESRLFCDLAVKKIEWLDKRRLELKSRLVKITHNLVDFRGKLDNELINTHLLQENRLRAFGRIELLRRSVLRTNFLRLLDRKSNDELHLLLTSYRYPRTHSYMEKVVEIAELVQETVLEDRKLKRAQANLMRHRRLWSRLRKSCT